MIVNYPGVLGATLSSWWLILAIAACLPQALITLVQAQSYDLAQLNWTLRNANGSIVIPAKIPSHVHLDLMEAGIITEPLNGINGASSSAVFPTLISHAHSWLCLLDITERWIVYDNWTYTADLSPFEATLPNDDSGKRVLVFFGLDTVANIVSPLFPICIIRVILADWLLIVE